MGGLLPCCSRGWFKLLKKRHLNSCLISIALLPYYWFLLTLLSYHLSVHFQMNWKVNLKLIRVCMCLYTHIYVYIFIHAHIYKFLGLYIFHIWPYLTAAVVQKSLPPPQTNKQTKPMRRKLWFSTVARVQPGRQEQLHSVCPMPFFGWTPAKGHLLAHLGIGFLEYQHLFQVEFKCECCLLVHVHTHDKKILMLFKIWFIYNSIDTVFYSNTKV